MRILEHSGDKEIKITLNQLSAIIDNYDELKKSGALAAKAFILTKLVVPYIKENYDE